MTTLIICTYKADIKNGKIDRSNFDANVQFLEGTGLFNENIKILEIGCGAGRLTNYLTQKRFNTIGIDISSALITEGCIHYPDAIIFIASGGDMPIKDLTFDIVLSFDVLEHIPDVDTHINEVRRILKPGGFYLLQTPNKLTNVPFEIIKNNSFTRYKKYHCSLQTYWSLKKLLISHGFEVKFKKIPVMNDFIYQKIEKVFGRAGSFLLKLVNPDRLPMPIRTNFYVCGRKNEDWNSGKRT